MPNKIFGHLSVPGKPELDQRVEIPAGDYQAMKELAASINKDGWKQAISLAKNRAHLEKYFAPLPGYFSHSTLVFTET